MKAPVRVLCWVALWLLSILAIVPTLLLLLFLIARETARERRVGERFRLLLLRAKLVYLRRRERQCVCRQAGERTIFRDVALF